MRTSQFPLRRLCHLDEATVWCDRLRCETQSPHAASSHPEVSSEHCPLQSVTRKGWGFPVQR